MASFLSIKIMHLVMLQILRESLKPLLTLNSRKYHFKRTQSTLRSISVALLQMVDLLVPGGADHPGGMGGSGSSPLLGK